MNPRTVLWHYTDAEGFCGIVSSHVLRLADARFLNDRTERTYGVQQVTNVIKRHLNSQPSELMSQIGGELGHPADTNLFVCSFSERNDSMSQWERYAASGYGYCLGVHKDKIERDINPTDVKLQQMLYTPKKQRKRIRERLNELLAEYDKEIAKKKTARGRRAWTKVYATCMAVELEELALELKNPDFRDEHEWRLIHEVRSRRRSADDDTDVLFARRGHLIKPYIELQLGPDTPLNPRSLPIAALVCGPKLEREVAIASAKYFLARHGYHVPVEHSKLSTIWR